MIGKLKTIKLKIESILGGRSPLWQMGGENQFLESIGIDPERTYTNKAKAIGSIQPVGSTALATGSSLTDTPMWIIGTNTSTGIYVYGAGGTLYTYSSTFTVQDDGGVGKVTGGAGDGACVYNDYIFLATKTDISRYGPLSSAAIMEEEFWSAAGHCNMAALTDNSASFIGTRSITYPEHVMHVHNDGYVYIGDYSGGRGLIHAFYFANDGTGTTATYAALTLPPGYIPTDIKSYGTDLAVLCSPKIDYALGARPKPQNSGLFLWDTVSDNFYRHVPINEALATAMVNKNGELYILSGALDQGGKLSRYLGGYSFQDLCQFEEGTPPPAGAVDALGNMVVWGVWGTVPTTYAGIMSYGHRNGALPKTASKTIMRISDTTNTLPVVSSLKFIGMSGYPRLGWRTDTSAKYGIDGATTAPTAFANVFSSKPFNIGKPFTIRRITIPLSAAVAAGTSIMAKVYVDNETRNYDLPDINNTNFTSSEWIIDFPNLAISGKMNFYLQFTWGGTAEVGLVPPIDIEVEVYD